ncbi:hypothetical protein LENED_003863 [Lentinula edodes]|uniref:Uncharacterized protein n=1 Tax=Lentinula edodes TaxID=5353 RepID=A0A1Q3E548_LENED|nr:hypothetical protein LENED_003863 [Lentinula edodes]
MARWTRLFVSALVFVFVQGLAQSTIASALPVSIEGEGEVARRKWSDHVLGRQSKSFSKQIYLFNFFIIVTCKRVSCI